MKILFDHSAPFLLAHGGQQIQIEETKRALEQIGIQVEWLRWWDSAQTGNIIHYFGIPDHGYLQRAEAKGLSVILTHLLSATCNRPDWKLRLQGLVIATLLRIPGWGIIRNQLTWKSLAAAKRIVVGLEAEKEALELGFNVEPKKVSVVPLGLSAPFLGVTPASRSGDYLITTGTIYEVKRSVELAQMARAANVPLLFVGKPYSETAPYWQEFKLLIDGHYVRYLPHVENRDEMVRLLQNARGFVLFSWFENWCLAAQEAVACGLPLLVQNQKWSQERFGRHASFLEPGGTLESNATRLKKFYDECPSLPVPSIPIPTWENVAKRLAEIYREVASHQDSH